MKQLIYILLLLVSIGVNSESFMMNPYGRENAVLLNGKWNAIIDLYNSGEKVKFYENRKPKSKTEFN